MITCRHYLCFEKKFVAAIGRFIYFWTKAKRNKGWTRKAIQPKGGRQWCRRQASKSIFSLVWPWPLKFSICTKRPWMCCSISVHRQLDVYHLSLWKHHLVNAYEVKAGTGVIADKTSMDNVSDIIFNIKNDKDAKVKIREFATVRLTPVATCGQAALYYFVGSGSWLAGANNTAAHPTHCNTYTEKNKHMSNLCQLEIDKTVNFHYLFQTRHFPSTVVALLHNLTVTKSNIECIAPNQRWWQNKYVLEKKTWMQ